MSRPNLPAPIAYLPALLMGAIVRVRNRLYDSGQFRARSLPRPVISIGNLTLGGTGKTPTVIRVAQLLADAGVQPVLLSRGYGRAAPASTLIVAPGRNPADAASVGDEPALIRRHVPTLWLALDGDRHRAASAMVARGLGDVFVMDDGFQHRALRRDLDIVVIDCTQPFARNRLIPWGTLREPIDSLSRSHVVLLNGGTPQDAERIETEVRRVAPSAAPFPVSQRIASVVPWEHWHAGRPTPTKEAQPFRKVFLVAAIGSPGRFVEDVRRTGREVCGSHFFRDHAKPDRKAWEGCVYEAKQAGADSILTTEKDAVKLEAPPPFLLGVCIQATSTSPAGEFEKMVLAAAGAKR